MKITSILFLLASIVFLDNVHAQTIKAYGVKFGISFADQQFESTAYVKTAKRQKGFDAAVFTEWSSSSLFSLVTQLELAQHGSIIHVSQLVEFGHGPPNSDTDVHNQLRYLSALVLGKFSLGKQSATPYALIGPRLDYLLGYSSDYHLLDDAYSQFKKVTPGASAGVGCSSGSLLPINVIVEARYNFDILNSGNVNNKIRNDSIDLWLGCEF